MYKSRLHRGLEVDSLQETAEDGNPLESLLNLSDIMLVLAVGLMCALLLHWGVNVADGSLSNAVEVEVTDDDLVERMDNLDGVDLSTGEGFEEYGTAYRDAEGNLYVLEKTEE